MLQCQYQIMMLFRNLKIKKHAWLNQIFKVPFIWRDSVLFVSGCWFVMKSIQNPI